MPHEHHHLALQGLAELTKRNYSGRGVGGGSTPDGENNVHLTFITARSDFSRDRVYRESTTEPGHVYTRLFSTRKLPPKSDLRIYNAMRSNRGRHIASNGSQTDSLVKYPAVLPSEALRRDGHTFEPDKLHTPRATSVIYQPGIGLGMQHSLHLVKKSPLFGAEGDEADELIFQPSLKQGCLHLIHTYMGENPDEPRSFEGEPLVLPVENDLVETGELVWNALPADLRICLAVKFIPISGSKPFVHIINGNKKK